MNVEMKCTHCNWRCITHSAQVAMELLQEHLRDSHANRPIEPRPPDNRSFGEKLSLTDLQFLYAVGIDPWRD